MVIYTKAQELVARSLLSGPKNLMEIKNIANLDANVLNDALKKLVALKVVELKGAEYKLVDTVTKGMKSAHEDNFVAIFIIEGVAGQKEVLMQRMGVLAEKIKLNLKPKEFEFAEPFEENNQFSTFIQFTAGFKDLHSIIETIVNYGPSSVEVLKPAKVELNSYDLQRIMSDVTSSVHYFATVILDTALRLQMLQKEYAKVKEELAKTLQNDTKNSEKNSTS